MNVQIGRHSIREHNIGRYGLHDDTNDNGSHLVDFALAHNLIIGGTLFEHKKIRKGTWKTPNGNSINQIDHILVDARHRSNLLDVRAFRGANVDSDHYLIGSKI
jgi:endonuclease/exonuclease/phosphatase family metal-dependent hydrolase